MMKTMKKMLATAVVIPAVLGSVSVFAAGGPGRDCGGPDGPRGLFDGGMMRMLNLSPEQMDQIRDIRHDMREDMYQERQTQRKVMREHRSEMQALVLNKNFDTAKATALAQKMVKEQVAHRVEMMKLHHKLVSVLTPDQRAKFADMMKNMPEPGMKPNMDRRCFPGGPDGGHRHGHGPRGDFGPDF